MAQETERGPTVVIPGPARPALPRGPPVKVAAVDPSRRATVDPPRDGRVAGLPAPGANGPAIGAVEGQAVPTAADVVLLAGAVVIRRAVRPPQKVAARPLVAMASAAPVKVLIHPVEAVA